MGISWDIGCVKCKVKLSLGFQKPMTYNGFNIAEYLLRHYLYIHANCSHEAGNLLIGNDTGAIGPWDLEDNPLEWKEDILSIGYWNNSRPNGNIACADCTELLSQDKNIRIQDGNIEKNIDLWFCNEECFLNYKKINEEDHYCLIYDSTNDVLPNLVENLFEIGCTKCRTYLSIDYGEEPSGFIRDMEYLAYFFSDHCGGEHLLKLNIDNNECIPWRNLNTDEKWTVYEW